VLVTFNLHPLVKRSPSEADRANEPRIIRALLLSAATGKVLRASEWRVPERGPYLWPLDKGHVLARTGNTLTIFGPSLVLQQQWTPPGTVRFVRISPSRSLIVVGIERERHTAEQHRVLAAFLGSDRSPEEDEDLTLLDEKLKVLGTESLNGAASLPAILDSGIVLSDAGTRQRWMVHQLTWAHKKQPIVRVASSCPIRVDTLPTNLILLAGCAADAASYWYKVVRPDGKVLLTGTAIVFDAPSRQNLTFQMVGRDELPNAIALNSSLFNASRIFGPASAGIVYGFAGAGVCFLVNALSFFAVLLSLLALRVRDFYTLETFERPEIFRGTLTGYFGAVYQIEGSTNLLDWSVVKVLTNTYGSTAFTDPAATTFGYRFYRASIAP